jgi:hypothetical protein
MDRKEIEKLYTSKGFPYRLTPQDQNEADFYDRAEGKEIHRRLEKVIRMRVPAGAGKNKEVIVYNETLMVQDKLGNWLYLNKDEQGKFPDPQFRYEWDQEARKERATSILGHNIQYEFPFSKQKMQEILDSNTEEEAETQFILMPTANTNTRYSGFTADEFLNRSFDELLTKGKTGEYPEELMRKEDKNQEEKSSQSEKKQIKEVKKGLIAEVEEKDSEEERKYADIVRAVDEETHAEEKTERQEQPEPQQKKSFGKKRVVNASGR